MFQQAAATAASSFGSQTQWDLGTMLKLSGISRDVQQHLVRVYSTLSLCVLMAGATAIGASSVALNVNTQGWAGLVSFLATTVGAIWLHMEPLHHHTKRFAILMGIAAAMGVSLTALIDVAIEMDPSVLVMAFVTTATVFLCFTGSALLATRRQYLYLGAMLSSALSLMCLGSVLNIFFRSTMLLNLNLVRAFAFLSFILCRAVFHSPVSVVSWLQYGGLLVFCGYVVFDTQMIIEKASMGDKDSIRHALELFMDFISIFVRIVVILLQNSDKKKRSNDRDRR
ncbi:TPA: hypothetical protein N0F65_005061 [Lagenidium giganteum]|uniref:Bax inhibitor 1 n=1 Tax=Lagenidium giganteum TaxID=4803 RepID=A0AAV2ZGZ6_9STRA|nr:TPA: hypothetical protein N0F65_005061 [Lagenidium giganteum]